MQELEIFELSLDHNDFLWVFCELPDFDPIPDDVRVFGHVFRELDVVSREQIADSTARGAILWV